MSGPPPFSLPPMHLPPPGMAPMVPPMPPPWDPGYAAWYSQWYYSTYGHYAPPAPGYHHQPAPAPPPRVVHYATLARAPHTKRGLTSGQG